MQAFHARRLGQFGLDGGAVIGPGQHPYLMAQAGDLMRPMPADTGLGAFMGSQA